MTNDEVVAKFLYNAQGMISAEDAEKVVDRVMHLEKVDDVSTTMDFLRPQAAQAVG
jgi:hypothetical protein